MRSIDEWASRIARINKSKGFEPPSMENLPGKLMLSVSELSEALEEHRSGNELLYFECEECHQRWESDGAPMSNHCGKPLKPEGIAVEIVDSVIRNLHMLRCLINENPIPLDNGGRATIEDVLTIKTIFNAMRPEKHGRGY